VPRLRLRKVRETTGGLRPLYRFGGSDMGRSLAALDIPNPEAVYLEQDLPGAPLARLHAPSRPTV
jgi:hypothetical protein